jgi:hypothetical protein
MVGGAGKHETVNEVVGDVEVVDVAEREVVSAVDVEEEVVVGRSVKCSVAPRRLVLRLIRAWYNATQKVDYPLC